MSAREDERASWARAYRPLRARTLSAQLVLLVAVEAVLFASYRHHEADFHWATHFLVGVSAAALGLLGWLAIKGAPARGQLLWVLGMHPVAMFPDLLFEPGHQPHDEWMGVFLGHISAHDVVGGVTTWLVTAVAASGAYCWVLSRWLAARHREVSAGLAPGIGSAAARSCGLSDRRTSRRLRTRRSVLRVRLRRCSCTASAPRGRSGGR